MLFGVKILFLCILPHSGVRFTPCVGNKPFSWFIFTQNLLPHQCSIQRVYLFFSAIIHIFLKVCLKPCCIVHLFWYNASPHWLPFLLFFVKKKYIYIYIYLGWVKIFILANPQHATVLHKPCKLQI